ncbi:hypothetical protein HJC23_011648 [Cyclotella cryptica]|uniref:Uncharacterized protein n=1 Tax=Cyclotella cryptica TaxID=29204 RepID=A0ABD3NKD9_9STRA|eukprot:CCRYP_020683-RA/>CCRYP_020683-RA protein AED:0.00 eAED:0.00 QI:158/-1/1/1/-1/1/1/280/147
MNPCSLRTKALILLSTVGAYRTDAFTTCPCNLAAKSSTIHMSASSFNRRNFVGNFGALATGTIMSIPRVVSALDFDAFEKGEIAADTKNCNPKLDPKCQPKLSPDEALCQYGNSGKARGEACRRVRDAGGKLRDVKKERSLGGAYAM